MWSLSLGLRIFINRRVPRTLPSREKEVDVSGPIIFFWRGGGFPPVLNSFLVSYRLGIGHCLTPRARAQGCKTIRAPNPSKAQKTHGQNRERVLVFPFTGPARLETGNKTGRSTCTDRIPPWKPLPGTSRCFEAILRKTRTHVDGCEIRGCFCPPVPLFRGVHIHSFIAILWMDEHLHHPQKPWFMTCMVSTTSGFRNHPPYGLSDMQNIPQKSHEMAPKSKSKGLKCRANCQPTGS